MSIRSCIEEARDRGEISPELAEALLRRYVSERMSAPTLEAQTEVARKIAIAGAEKRRRDLLSATAKNQILKDVGQYRTPRGQKDMVEAMNSLFENFGHSGYLSVRALKESYDGIANSKIADVLEKFSRTAISGRRINKPLLRDVRKASFGETTTPEAKALYDSFAEAAEFLRSKFNEYGGAIPKRKDWGMPQSHDPFAVQYAFKAKSEREGMTNWSNFIDPLLDWANMTDLAGEKFGANLPPDRRMGILRHVWREIVSEGMINSTPSAQPSGRGSLATQRTEHRYLKFKDADSASRYNREFGTGDEFVQMTQHLRSMASDVALMHRFGPNPAGMLNLMQQMLDLEVAKARVGDEHALRANGKNAEAKVDLAKKILDGFYEQYRGDRQGNGYLALTGTVLRNWYTSALLGSSVIPHMTTNWIIQSFARYAGGIPFARVIPQLLGAFRHSSHAEMTRAGLDIENGMHHIGAGAAQLGKFAKIANWSKWLPDRTTHWFGLQPIVEANRISFNQAMMGFLADNQNKSWTQLPTFFRLKLQGYGIRPQDWRVLQLVDLYSSAPGAAKWLRPIDVLNMAGGANINAAILDAAGRYTLDATTEASEAQKIAHEVAFKLLGYMNSEREIAVPTSSARARARIFGTTNPNTVQGQVWRSFGMFKNFVGSFMVSQVHTMKVLLARNVWHGLAYIAAITIAMTLGGMVALQLKQARSGKDFAPMNPLTGTGFVTWLRAYLQSNTFGIFGDFLAADHSSYGVGPLETLAGPVAELPIGATEGGLDLIRHAYDGNQRHSFGSIAGDAATKFLRGATPFASTGWPIAAAYNRLILDQLQMLFDPNAHQKMRRSEVDLRRSTGQRYFWRPGEISPGGFPAFTPSR